MGALRRVYFYPTISTDVSYDAVLTRIGLRNRKLRMMRRVQSAGQVVGRGTSRICKNTSGVRGKVYRGDDEGFANPVADRPGTRCYTHQQKGS